MTFFRGSKIGFSVSGVKTEKLFHYPFTSDLSEIVSGQDAFFYSPTFMGGTGVISYLDGNGNITQGTKPLISGDGIFLGGGDQYQAGFQASSQPYLTTVTSSASWAADDGINISTSGPLSPIPARRLTITGTTNSGCRSNASLSASTSSDVSAVFIVRLGEGGSPYFASAYARLGIASGTATTPAGAGCIIRMSDGAFMGSYSSTAGWTARGVKIDKLANNMLRVRIYVRTGSTSSIRAQIWAANNISNYSCTSGSSLRIGYIGLSSGRSLFENYYANRIPLDTAEVLNNNFLTMPTTGWPKDDFSFYYESKQNFDSEMFWDYLNSYSSIARELFGALPGDNGSSGLFTLGAYNKITQSLPSFPDSYTNFSGNVQILAANSADIGTQNVPFLTPYCVLFSVKYPKVYITADVNGTVLSAEGNFVDSQVNWNGWDWANVPIRVGFGTVCKNLKIFSGRPDLNTAKAA